MGEVYLAVQRDGQIHPEVVAVHAAITSAVQYHGPAGTAGREPNALVGVPVVQDDISDVLGIVRDRDTAVDGVEHIVQHGPQVTHLSVFLNPVLGIAFPQHELRVQPLQG